MRRFFASALLALAACGSPPPPAPPVPVLVVPAAAPPPAPPEVASVEILPRGFRALDAMGQELFRHVENQFSMVVPVPGGAVAAASYGELSVIGEHGAVRWSAKPGGYGRPVAGPGVVMFATGIEVFVFDLKDGAPRGRVFVGDDFVAREGGEPSFRLPLRLFPGEALATPQREVAVGSDGTILVGASDGSLLSLDASGTPRFQTAVRSAVRGIEARPGGNFVVHTWHGDVEVGPLGVKAEPPSRGRPTLAFQVGASPLQDKVFRDAVPYSVVYVRPDDVWALVARVGKAAVRHYDGKTWHEIRTPDLHELDPRCWVAFEDSAYARCSQLPVGRDSVGAEALARSADGRILLLGVERVPMRNAPAWVANELRVWEHVGGVFRPHRELSPVSGKLISELGGSAGTAPRHATGPGGQEIFCLNGVCLARGLSPDFDLGPEQKLTPSGAPGWSTFAWNAGEWFQSVVYAFAGRALWRADEATLSRDGKIVRTQLTEGGRAMWASGEDDLWVLARSYRGEDPEILHWDGKAFSRVPVPFRDADEIKGTGPDDVWVTDGRSAAHFDGQRFSTIAGVSGRLVVVGREEAWIGGEHVFRNPKARADLAGAASPLPPPAAPSRPLVVGPMDPSLRIERAAVEGFAGALGIAEGPSGEIWIHDGTRVAAIDGASTHAIHAAPHDLPLRCGRCLAPGGDGSGLILARAQSGEVSLLPVMSGRSQAPLLHAPALLAAARSSSGSTWIVGAAEEDTAPHALVHGADGLRLVQGLPVAAYADVAPRADDDAWLAGGLSSFDDGTRTWPSGEGILVHFDGRAFTRLRAPDGALLSVAAVGPGEAWAVGQGGGVLHVRGDTVETFHLVAADGAPLRHALRAVAAAGRDDVLIAGDAGTLLHWDGHALRRVDTRAAGPEAGFSALIAPSKKPGWLVGPSGVWRVTR